MNSAACAMCPTRGCGAGTYGNERKGACRVDSDAKGELEFAVLEGAVVEASLSSTAGESACRSRLKVDLSDAVGTPVLRRKEGAGTMSVEQAGDAPPHPKESTGRWGYGGARVRARTRQGRGLCSRA